MTKSSWPWMKDVDEALAEQPIDPVDAFDQRPSVNELIAEHREKIDKIRAGIQDNPLFDASKHDDLWLLRFWLSHKKSKNAIAAATHTLEFRKKHQLDDKDIRGIPPHQTQNDTLNRHSQCHDDAVRLVVPDSRRGVVLFAKMAGIDQNKCVEELSEDDILNAYIYWSEWSHQNLDYVTRTTGRLTKSIRFIDLADMKIMAVNHKYNTRESKAVQQMDDCFPQMLEKIYLFNCPVWVQIPWRVVRPLMPKRVVSKIDFIDPARNEKERKRLFMHISEENLPTLLGGKNPEVYLGCYESFDKEFQAFVKQ